MEQITARRQIVQAKDYDELCSLSVEKILRLSNDAIKANGRCTMALSGGSTPRGIFSLMAGQQYKELFDWERIYFFLVDERWVPFTSPRSNYKMISETLGENKKIPISHFHPVNTGTSDVTLSAEMYEKELISYFGLEMNELPDFDIILLGLGEDGHTASLFPGNSAVDEKKKLVVPVIAYGIAEKRISLTFPAINNARTVLFLVSGSGKSKIVNNIFNGHEPFPAGKVNPIHGETIWYLDEDAGRLLFDRM